MSICSWNSSDARATCKFPAPFSTDTHGGGRWLCVWHFRLRDQDKVTRSVEGDAIIEQSFEWDGTPESYLALRALTGKKQEGRHSVGSEEEGEGQMLRNVRDGSGAVQPVPRPISELVPDLQPEPF